MPTVINSEKTVYGTQVSLELIVCYKCGVPFGVPDTLKEHFKKTQECFFCPNGHEQAYVKTLVQIEKEKSEREKQELERQLYNARSSSEHYLKIYKEEHKKNIVLKGQKTKLLNRAKNGVCPCCNRTFSNVANHIKSKHPELLTETK